MKPLLPITFALLLSLAGVASAQTADALLLKHCSACHNPEESQGQVDLVTLLKQTPLVRNTSTWRIVMDRIDGGEMPPNDEPQPSNEERQELLNLLTRAIDQFDYSQIDNPGYEPARRLSNIEYDNTVSDLFGLTLRPSSKFPTDLSGKSGFDNSANTLFLQPQLFLHVSP